MIKIIYYKNMEIKLALFFILLPSYFLVLPTWDFTKSVTDLLPGTGEKTHSYVIDERYDWYEATDKLVKEIKRDRYGRITHKNTLDMHWHSSGSDIYKGEVEFESIESFYGFVDNEASHPIICPKGSYNPYEIPENHKKEQMQQINYRWIKNSKFELKCFYHREEPFLVFYLMNSENYVLRIQGTNFNEYSMYKFGSDFEEIYDFKLQNRLSRKKEVCSPWNNPYPFMALVKKDNYLQIVATYYDMHTSNNRQYIKTNNQKLIRIKKYTQAYFNNFHFNNSFFYFTYNTIQDFTSGYSTTPVPNEKDIDYSEIGNVKFKNNLESPFEFSDEVEIKEMNIMYNNNFVYFTILNKVTNVLYHGILDIYTNKVVWNTDKEVTLFIPYVTTRYTSDQGNYEYADSMLVITKDSAYRVCGIKDGGNCVYKCPDNKIVLADFDGTKCSSFECCAYNGRLLLPERICIPQKQCNTTIYKMDSTYCGLCRDMENRKKYRFIGGTNCLDQSILLTEGVIINNEKFYLLECDKGYILQNDKCFPHCYSTCLRCNDYSTNKNDQKCKTCISGYYLVDNTNCEIIPTTIPEIIPTTIIEKIPTTIITPIPTTIIEKIPTTIITPIPTTIIEKIPTTIITPISTTIIEKYQTTIPTLLLKIISTTIPIAIPTSAPTIISTTFPATITNTIPKAISSTITETTTSKISSNIPTTTPIKFPKTIPATPSATDIIKLPTTIISKIPTVIPQTNIIQDICKYGVLINYTSSFSNLTNGEIYEHEIQNIINSYCIKGSSVIVKGQHANFEVTTSYNEVLDKFKEDLSKVNLTECENILKDIYHIDQNDDLIILKFIMDDGYTLKYDMFNPYTREKLNLSYCENTTTDVYVPYTMDEKTEQIYNNLKDQGYNPLDQCDKFYREICTPYKSENGTDVLLDDREEFIYTSLVNATVCPIGCNYSEFYAQKKYIKCECNTNISGIELLDLEHISSKNIGNSFLSTLKSTNWKVMRCYNLVFNLKIFVHNYGSIFVLILFIIYVVFIIYYCFKEINPLKVEISRILFEESSEQKEKENIICLTSKYRTKTEPKSKDKIKHKKVYYPPKKLKSRSGKSEYSTYGKSAIKTEEKKLVIFNRKEGKKATKKTTFKEISSKKVLHNKDNDLLREDMTKIDEDNKNGKKLDNFELNNLEYNEACELDKRTFCRTYWSVLMREHTALITFVAWNDYNLFYIKIERFLILFCVDMTMNGLFFVHESMHRKYTQGENFTFVQKLPQLLFTLIAAHIIEVILCFLSMTDTHVYEIKELPMKEKKKGQKIMDIISCIQRKLTSFIIFTFILFLFFWYFISAFCAVYQNTQSIFLRDSMVSFAISLIDPFIIYCFTSLLRWISLMKICRKICCGRCLYKTSDIIPIF